MSRCVFIERIFASGTAKEADSSKPEPQIASKPASAASFAASGLCAAIAIAGRWTSILARSAAALRWSCAMVRAWSAHRGGDIAAIDRGDVGSGLERERVMHEGLRDVLGGDFAAEQVAAHVVFFAQVPRF